MASPFPTVIFTFSMILIGLAIVIQGGIWLFSWHKEKGKYQPSGPAAPNKPSTPAPALWHHAAPMASAPVLSQAFVSPPSTPATLPKPASPASSPAVLKNPDPPAQAVSPEKQIPDEIRDVVLFFIELHRLEMGLPKNALRRFSPVTDDDTRKMQTFELFIKGIHGWNSRRMSISPLGEKTGSKSKCFYVIYDSHWVVKLPPTPIKNITRYIASIRREVGVAARLAPVACIVPSVSMVLKRVKKVPRQQGRNFEEIEEHYLQLVKETPELQEMLRISGNFALFMELSNDFFVGSVIRDLHAKIVTRDNIRSDLDMAWEQEAFIARYGLAEFPVFEKIQRLGHVFTEIAPQVLRKMNVSAIGPLQTWQLKNWLLMTLSGHEQPEDLADVDPEFKDAIKTAFSDIFTPHQDDVKTVLHFFRVQRETHDFSKKQRAIGNIASKLLMLLSHFGEKKVALRDLKPDNLFISSTSTNYPAFLNDAEKFEIGVIDVETAVSLEPDENGTIAQPLLGGTPLYATPLHILNNDTLSRFFGDPGKLLHYEDWFAMTAIIFKVICGKNLFLHTARSFPEIVKNLKIGKSTPAPGEAALKILSRKFWSMAKADLQHQLTAHAHLLEQLFIEVPPRLTNVLKTVLKQEKTILQRAILARIASASLVQGGKDSDFLRDASPVQITKQMERWRQPQNLPAPQRPMARDMLLFLLHLRKLKQKEAEKNEAIAALTVFPHPLRADLLLSALFQIVYQIMCPAPWRNAQAARQGAACGEKKAKAI